MHTAFIFMIIGYFSGSVLFAQLTARLFGKPDIMQGSKDGNPGTANAFMYGGFLCGIITLFGDLFKGAPPINMYQRFGGSFESHPILSAFVLAAPVLGHVFSCFFDFHGGKGIAVTFGCLIGLFPNYVPAVTLALFFIFFSLILRITPHFYRTLTSYLFALICLFVMDCGFGILLGFLLITLIVYRRFHMSTEEREEMKVKLLWMH